MKRFKEVVVKNTEVYNTDDMYKAKGIAKERLEAFKDNAVDAIMSDSDQVKEVMCRYISSNPVAMAAIVEDVMEAVDEYTIKQAIGCVVKRECFIDQQSQDINYNFWKPQQQINICESKEKDNVSIDMYGWINRTPIFGAIG